MRPTARRAIIVVGVVMLAALALWLLPRLLRMPQVLAEGVQYYHRVLPGPVRVHVVVVDSKSSRARLRVRSAGGTLANLAPLEPIAIPRNATETVLAAVNGGQFDRDGTPIGLLVRDGAMLRGASGRPVLTFNDAGAPLITEFDGYHMIYATEQFGLGVDVDRYNRPGAGDVCVYSDVYPFDVPVATGGTVLRVQGVAPHGLYPPSRPTYGRVERIDRIEEATSVTVAPGKLLVRLSGQRAAQLTPLQFINQLVSFTGKVQRQLWTGEIAEALGGSHTLLADGRIPAQLRDDERMGLDNARDARTAVGYSADRKKIYLVVVEGAHSGSVGMTFSQLAAFMQQEKLSDAINLDGGGSSGLWLAGRGVVTLPDESRPINNALVLVN